MSIKTTRYDAAKYIETTQDQVELLDDAFASGDPRVIVHAIGTVARARGMTELAQLSGIGRSSLYKAVADDANPTLETLLKVMDALKLQLGVSAAAE